MTPQALYPSDPGDEHWKLSMALTWEPRQAGATPTAPRPALPAGLVEHMRAAWDEYHRKATARRDAASARAQIRLIEPVPIRPDTLRQMQLAQGQL